MMKSDLYSVSVTHLFSVVQACVGKTYKEILIILEDQGMSQVKKELDPLMKFNCIHCETETEIALKFDFKWEDRLNEAACCQTIRMLISMETAVNPYLYHCFRNYQRLSTLLWADLQLESQVEVSFFEEGFIFSFTQADKEELIDLLDA